MARILPFGLFLVIAALPTIASAQSTPVSPADAPVEVVQSEGTKKMVAILKDVAKKYDDSQNILANKTRVKFLTELVKTRPENEVLLYQEMIFAGMNEKAIEGLRSMQGRAGVPPTVQARIPGLLAIAYLRQAEQDNCVLNHTAQSCLFPIQPGGYHSIQRGSRAAIEVLTSTLNQNPGDVKSRWLLNLAYMTLGEYPDKVPPQWLYSPELFRSDYDLPRFNDIAPTLGVDIARLSGGICVEDFDGDGDMDFMTSSLGVYDQVLYYGNNGDGTFSDRTKAAGIEGITGGLNMFHADYNNDGYADVFITRGAWMGLFGNQPNSLLRNNGNGTFSDVTIEAGVLSFRPTEAATWGDYDNDGWLDLFIGNETALQHHPSELYRNNGDGTFTNVAREVGLDLVAMVKAVVWGDYNNDGLIDLYVSSLGQVNHLFKNNGKKNGKWSFTDVAVKAGVQDPKSSFPAFFFDYNNDGWLDIYVTDFGGQPTGLINGLPAAMKVVEPMVNDYLGNPPMLSVPKLYRNNKNGTFTDVAKEMRLDKTLFGMGCNFGDLDNDGYLDIYVGTGHPDLDALVPNRMFRNAEGKIFQDVTSSGGFGHLQKGHGIGWADVDSDGDQDILAVMGGAYEADIARMVFFQNPGNKNHWITLILEGVKANRLATGARIKVSVLRADGTKRDIHIVAGTGGSFGSSSLQQEIGLGDARQITSITIDWPGSHTKQTINNIEMDRTIKIREGSNDITVVERPIISMPPSGLAPAHQHGGHHDHHH